MHFKSSPVFGLVITLSVHDHIQLGHLKILVSVLMILQLVILLWVLIFVYFYFIDKCNIYSHSARTDLFPTFQARFPVKILMSVLTILGVQCTFSHWLVFR